MNLRELYDQTPAEHHHEIVVSGDRVFFNGEEYIIPDEGELKLIRSQKWLEQKLSQITTQLGI